MFKRLVINSIFFICSLSLNFIISVSSSISNNSKIESGKTFDIKKIEHDIENIFSKEKILKKINKLGLNNNISGNKRVDDPEIVDDPERVKINFSVFGVKDNPEAVKTYVDKEYKNFSESISNFVVDLNKTEELNKEFKLDLTNLEYNFLIKQHRNEHKQTNLETILILDNLNNTDYSMNGIVKKDIEDLKNDGFYKTILLARAAEKAGKDFDINSVDPKKLYSKDYKGKKTFQELFEINKKIFNFFDKKLEKFWQEGEELFRLMDIDSKIDLNLQELKLEIFGNNVAIEILNGSFSIENEMKKMGIGYIKDFNNELNSKSIYPFLNLYSVLGSEKVLDSVIGGINKINIDMKLNLLKDEISFIAQEIINSIRLNFIAPGLVCESINNSELMKDDFGKLIKSRFEENIDKFKKDGFLKLLIESQDKGFDLNSVDFKKIESSYYNGKAPLKEIFEKMKLMPIDISGSKFIEKMKRIDLKIKKRTDENKDKIYESGKIFTDVPIISNIYCFIFKEPIDVIIYKFEDKNLLKVVNLYKFYKFFDEIF